MEFGYEYLGRDGALITIRPNERYVLLAKTNDHWWQVREDHSSKSFYIPAKYVKELPLELPSPLDFAHPPGPEPVPPATAPVPVPVPVPIPKPLEEPRTKSSDEVTIRLTPDAATRHRKNENRMSTFGVLMDFQDVVPRHPSSAPAGPADTGTKANSRTTNSADSKKQPHLSGYLEDIRDSGKLHVPSFSPADPLSIPRPHAQLIRVEMPVVPPNSNAPNPSSSPAGHQDGHESPAEPEEELLEEEASMEESGEEEQDSVKGEDSNHIYESIQDLNLDLEALVGGRVSPGPAAKAVPPEPAAAPPPTQVRHLLRNKACGWPTWL